MLRSRYAATTRVRRGYVNASAGAIHYRTAGQGPALLALHQSPDSSVSMLPLITGLCDRYQVIAPDTPGYGLSEPLSQTSPSADDFADALAGFLDGLGLERVAVYGAHTGADLAMALAGRFPGRVTALALDGVSAFTPEEIRSFETDYLSPYAPDWEGRHVMALWSRVKDAAAWFPWHERTANRRLATEPQALDGLDQRALGFLQAGVHYAKAYLASARFDPNQGLRAICAPTTIFARPTDLLHGHLSRLEERGPWRIQPLGVSRRAWAQTIREAIARGDTPDSAPGEPSPALAGPGLLAFGEGYLQVRSGGPTGGEVRVLLADLPGSSADLLVRQRKLHPEARLVAIDPPGCGGSDPMAVLDLDRVIDTAALALDRLDVQPSIIVGEGGAGAIAALLGRRVGARVELLRAPAWLLNPAAGPASRLLDPLKPRWDGAHLTGAWFQLRDLALYDVPPGCGRPVRRDHPQTLEVLDARFRAFVAGPDAASLLDQSLRLSGRTTGLLDGALDL